MEARFSQLACASATRTTRACSAALAGLLGLLALSCSSSHPCFGPVGSWKPFVSVRLFGERWNPHLIFDELGRSSLLWEDSMFYAAEKCGGLTAAEKNDLVSAWEAAFAEPFSSPRDGIAVFSSPGHVYVLESVEELDGNPLLREAITTTLRLALTQYSGRRLQRFLEEHPLGVLLE